MSLQTSPRLQQTGHNSRGPPAAEWSHGKGPNSTASIAAAIVSEPPARTGGCLLQGLFDGRAPTPTDQPSTDTFTLVTVFDLGAVTRNRPSR